MTEKQLREKVVSIMKGWIGCKESNGSHKKIIDTYNAHKPLARGYKVKYTDEWCATTVSAAFITAKLTDIAPTECSCAKMIELYKAKGRWKESDGYTPKIGDIIMYDWQDKGSGDNTGHPDHVGIVASVSGKTIKVIEGNKGQAVAYRSMTVNGKYIRGYCLPNYASKSTPTETPQKASTTGGNTSVTVSLPTLKNGSQGKPVTSLQQLLTAKGYSTQGIDGKFGDNTASALRRYQKAKGLTQDGVCGKNSWTALLTK